MIRHLFSRRGAAFSWTLLAVACSKSPQERSEGTGGMSSSGAGVEGTGGAAGNSAEGGASGGGDTAALDPKPKYYPVPSFKDCHHAEVTDDCENGWCKLPPSCFVMGSPEDEWERGLNTENQAAVTLTHSIEVQQMELTRAEWTSITGEKPLGPETCTDAKCPVSMVSWWDAIMTADLLSQKQGLEACYSPVECTGSLGADLECSGVADPDKSVYECEGYRLPTRAEVEYAARAGTWSTWYSGDITPATTECHSDPALELIAWYCFNSENRGHVGGELKDNGFGLFDMIGNVEEWVSESKTGASPGGSDPRGTVGSSERRLLFGGRYTSSPHILRTANLLSGSWKHTSRGDNVGFRLYRTLFEDSERSAGIVSE